MREQTSKSAPVDVVVHAYTPGTQAVTGDRDVKASLECIRTLSFIYMNTHTHDLYMCVKYIYINYIYTTSFQHGFDN